MKNQEIDMFDSLYSTPQSQILKTALPYLAKDYQKMVAIYIKFEEFQHTMTYLSNYPVYGNNNEEYNDPSNLHKIYHLLKKLSPYLPNKEKLNSLLSFLKTIENIEPLLPMIEKINQQENDDNFDIYELLKENMNEEQLSMIDLIVTMSNMSNNENNENKE